MARKGSSILDETKRSQILAILAVGCSRQAAARYVGCCPSTIRSAALRDPDFARCMEQAEGRGELSYVERIHRAAGKEQYWRAAAWMLERRHPEEWAPRDPKVLTVDDARQLLAALAQIVVDEVPAAAYRKQVLRRVGGLLTEARAPQEECPEPPSEPDHARG